MFDAPVAKRTSSDQAEAAEEAFGTLLGFVKACQDTTIRELVRIRAFLGTDQNWIIANGHHHGFRTDRLSRGSNVLHRDFKPGNIVLVASDKGTRAVITDFGLALRSKEELTQGAPVTGTGQTLGTPAYMSPEQVEGKDLTPASDVYSLGLVLYQMITGTRPFDDSTALSMAVRRIKEDPPPPHTLVPDVDPRWEKVILHCLQRDPKLRASSPDLRNKAAPSRDWKAEKRAPKPLPRP